MYWPLAPLSIPSVCLIKWMPDWQTHWVADWLAGWVSEQSVAKYFPLDSFNKLSSDNCKCKLCCLPLYEYLPNRIESSQWAAQSRHPQNPLRPTGVQWAESHALRNVHWVRFLSFDNCETWLSCLRLSAAIKTKCCHIKHLLKVDFGTTSTLADTFKQIYLNKFGNYEKSRIKQRLVVKFNLKIRQSFNYSESERERANEALETRHDTTLKCGSSITIAVPKVALIHVRHSRKRPKRMQDGMR